MTDPSVPGPGFTTRTVETERLSVGVLERTGDDAVTDPARTLLFLHDVTTSSVFWRAFLRDLPASVRAVAVDLRGFGDSENAPVDATRGVRDFSDDLAGLAAVLGLPALHLVGWGFGGAVAMQYALDHPVLSLTLVAPVSPYGFGGTRADGTRLTDDDAGTGAGMANPGFVQRLVDHDATDAAETSPRTVLRHTFVADGFSVPDEDDLVAGMLSTSTAVGNYPGEPVPSSTWPGFAPGTSGVLNALAPRWFDVSGIADLADKPPVLWVRGDADPVISDTSFSDPRHLGALGVIPDWPGEEIAPAQPMVSQTRRVLDAYAAGGGIVREVVLEGVGHSPQLERPDEVRRALLDLIGVPDAPAASAPEGPTDAAAAAPAPTTEQIILRSTD